MKILKRSIEDNKNSNISVLFDETFNFIDNAIKNNENVFVFCALGVSRSATIVIAYLMRKNSLKFEEAFKVVKNKRSIIDPNSGFIEQLKRYEDILNKC